MGLIYAGGSWRNVPDTAQANTNVPVLNNASGSSPAAVAAMIQNAPSPPPSMPNSIGSTSNAPASSQGANGGGGSAPSPAPAPAPPPPPPPPPNATTYSVKQPDVALVQYDAEVLPQELITDLLYEDVGGTELINIARHDTIDGQNVVYSLVRNLSILNQAFNPNNILAGQAVYSSFLNQYALDIANKLGANAITLDTNGNLVIEFSSTNPDEYVEVEISTDGTIYKIGV